VAHDAEFGMRGLLPSVGLIGAALYTASILSLTKPFAEENWPAPPPVTETVVAKTPPAITTQALGGFTLVLAALPAKPKAERRNELVQVTGYTAMVRSRPSPLSPPRGAYTAGKPLRVIAKEGAYVKIQDLGSGQLGWIEEASLAPFAGGYRRPTPAAPLVASVTPQPEPSLVASAEAAPAPAPAHMTSVAATPLAARKPKPPRGDAIAAKLAKETVAEAEPEARGLFRRNKRAVQRVALGGRNNGLTGMIDRAIRGF
jgi:hypothetical protein